MADPLELDSERSRIRNALVNTGVCASFVEAEQRLADSRLHIHVSAASAATPAGQAAALTAASTASRCFGTVFVTGDVDADLVVPLPLRSRHLRTALAELGAHVDPTNVGTCRTVFIGAATETARWSVQAHWDGWLAGVVPGRTPLAIGREDCSLAGVAAGALAVGQAFLAEQGDVRAGRAAQRVSLWEPDAPEAISAGPLLSACYLPLEYWLIGLGNLGQAYLWSISALPFQRAQEVLVFVQDDDTLKKENWGTSILAKRGRYGLLKTRIAEEWAERRGFRVRRVDRRLDEHQRRSNQEPALALAGLDRMPPRRLLGRPGFDYVIDAGLGATATDYRWIRVSSFGPSEDPAERFAGVEDQADQVAEQLRKLPAYQAVESIPAHGTCGAATLAGQAVVVPFVSAVAGAFVVAQAIRIASGEAMHTSLTADLGDLRSVRANRGRTAERLTFKFASAAK